MRSAVVCVAAASACGLISLASVSAAPVTFNFTSGTYAAEAVFDTSGTDLVVTLTNTSTSDVLVPIDVLTGVFFDIAGSPLSLIRTSATLNAGSSVLFPPSPATDAGGVVGGEWGYLGALSGAPNSAQYGISSSGLGLFGPGDVFPGTNLQGSADPNGLQYGITSAGDNSATGNTPVTGGSGGNPVALIKNSVVFVLSGLPANFDPSTSIGNVSFQYGTGLEEPNFLVPAPGLGLSAGLMGAMALGRRRRR